MRWQRPGGLTRQTKGIAQLVLRWCAYRSPWIRPVHWLAYHMRLEGTEGGADLLDAAGFHTKAAKARQARAARR
jgi:hypothetical protein